ncbi:MAG: TRAP transporter small permease [Ramlibacter sp.]
MKPVLARACDLLARAVRFVVVALALVMLASLALQVVMRYVFGQAQSWTEELAVTCFSWSMLLAIAAGVREGIHVRMDLLVDRLPAPLQRGLDKLVTLAIAATGGFIAWSGVNYVRDAGGITSAAIGYSLTWLYACAPVCGALIAVFAIERLVLGPRPPVPAAT